MIDEVVAAATVDMVGLDEAFVVRFILRYRFFLCLYYILFKNNISYFLYLLPCLLARMG
jgi:hypothetical protein